MSDILERLRTALSDRYRVEKELGAGGMAIVYLAEDLKLERRVAIKVLRPELAATIGGERFLREIRITAGLSHPNILSLIDSGDAGGGILYYVMPFVEGESLRQRLTREKQLPIPDALAIADAVAGALAFAHRSGLIHRDIKPENILLGPEQVLVADFGIARAIQPGAGQMTETGLALGTPGYMSPEQALGEQTLDARSDVYSLGCMLYEMLVGEPPFTGPTAQAIVARVMGGTIPNARATRDTIPEAIDEVIATALAKAPADRYQDAGKFAEALTAARTAAPRRHKRFGKPTRGTIAAFTAGVAAVAAAVAVFMFHQSRAEAAVPSLVVLPFENLGKADDAGFADGVTDEITAKLADVQGMTVKARQAALPYRGTTKTPQQIAKELKVDYILGATLSWEQNAQGQRRVRVRPQLTRGADGKSVWSKAFDEDATEVFVVQANIANQVVAALAPAIVAQAGGPKDAAKGDAAGYYKTALTRAIPQDPDLKTGTLDNGLRYYVRNNALPAGRAEFRLVVEPGSVLERDGQFGYVHLIQHVAFGGSALLGERYLSFFQSLGSRFGNDVNGNASYDRTALWFRVPTARPAVVDTAVRLLRSWASDVQFDPKTIDRARRVVFEEWRNARATDPARSTERIYAEFLKGIPGAEHLPSGDSATVAHADPAALSAFYHGLFRPERMAVVIVGDIPADSAERLVRKYFADFKASGPALSAPAAAFPDRRETSVAVIPAPGTIPYICICFQRRPDTVLTIGAYRETVVRRLFVSLFDARFTDHASEPNAPFLRTAAIYSNNIANVNLFGMQAMFVDSSMTRALEGALVDAERVARYGFTDGEIERAKGKLLRSMQQAYDERGKRMSETYADEYVASFISGSPVAGNAFEYGLFKRFLPTITAAELRELGHAWLADRNRSIIAQVEQTPATRTADADLRAVLHTVSLDDVKPYEERAHAALPAATAKAGSIVKEEKIPAVDATTWTLSNGARVILKTTDFKADEIIFRAYRPGGLSASPDAEASNAALAPLYASRMGFGNLSAADLQRSVADKVAVITVGASPITEELSGNTSPKDMEAFLQLLSVHFTAPRRDTAVYQSVKAQIHSSYAARARTPASVFEDSTSAIVAAGVPMLQPFTEARVDVVDLDKMLAIYRMRFGDANGFTFVFVGNLDPAAMRPLVEKYIGSLPTSSKTPKARDIGFRAPTGIVRRTIVTGDNTQALSSIIFAGNFSYSEADRSAMRSVADALRIRLVAQLREQQGASFNPVVAYQYEGQQPAWYRFDVRIPSAPARADELVATTLRIIADLAANGPTEQEVAQVRATERQTKETALRDNRSWAGQLVAIARYGVDPRAIPSFEWIDKQTSATIRDAAKKFLPADRYYIITSKAAP